MSCADGREAASDAMGILPFQTRTGKSKCPANACPHCVTIKDTEDEKCSKAEKALASN